MAAIAKRVKAWKAKLTPGKHYPVDEALTLVKEFATAKFAESVDAAVNLGIDASKSDQQVRGSTVMPHGTGKTVRVAVFTSGKNQDAARAAGADIVGLEDLAEKVKAGEINFDVVIASPDAMRVVGQLGQILGPRGLMPNPKVGTVTPDVAERGQERQGRPGALPRRQGRHRARADRPREFRGQCAQGQSAGADRRSAEGQAGRIEGHLSEARHRVLDHGSGDRGGSVDAGAVGTGQKFFGLVRAGAIAGHHRRPQANPRIGGFLIASLRR